VCSVCVCVCVFEGSTQTIVKAQLFKAKLHCSWKNIGSEGEKRETNRKDNYLN